MQNGGWKTIVAPYSLEQGKVGEPVGRPMVWNHYSHIEALIHLGNLIFGAHWKKPYEIAGKGNSYRIYVESPEGEELPFNALYERVEKFLGTSGKAMLKQTVADIRRYRDLFDKHP